MKPSKMTYDLINRTLKCIATGCTIILLAFGPPRAEAEGLKDVLQKTVDKVTDGVIEILEEKVIGKKDEPTSEDSQQGDGATPPLDKSNDEVRLSRTDRQRIQQRLNDLGYDAGPVDGDFGPRTRTAIRTYQIDNGLKATGQLSQTETNALLLGRPIDLEVAESGDQNEDRVGTSNDDRFEPDLRSPETPNDTNMADGENADPVTKEVAKRYGIPLLHGHLLMPLIEPTMTYFDVSVDEIHNRWFRFIFSNNYNTHSPTFGDSVVLASEFMSEQEQRMIYERYNISGLDGSYDVPGSFKYTLNNRLDEFDKRDFHSYVKNEYAPSVIGSETIEHVNVLLANSLIFGEYNFEQSTIHMHETSRGLPNFKGKFSGHTDVVHVRGFYWNAFDLAKWKWNDSLRLPEQQAKEIIRRFSGNGGGRRVAYSGVFGSLKTSDLSLPYEIDHVILSYDHALSDIVMPVSLTDLMHNEDQIAREYQAKKQKERAVAAAKEQQLRKQRATEEAEKRKVRRIFFPDRNLHVFGIELGMPVSEATELLVEKFESTETKPIIQARSGIHGVSRCRVLEGQIEKEMASKRLEFEKENYKKNRKLQVKGSNRERIRAKRKLSESQTQSLAKQEIELRRELPGECAAEIKPFVFATGLEVRYNSYLSETIEIYTSGHPELNEKVVAIVRRVKDRNKNLDFENKVAEEYGDIRYKLDNSRTYWFESPDIHNRVVEEKKFRNDCVAPTPWPLNQGISHHGFVQPCGKFLGILSRKGNHDLFLVDTDYVTKMRKIANSHIEKIKEEEKNATIQF